MNALLQFSRKHQLDFWDRCIWTAAALAIVLNWQLFFGGEGSFHSLPIPDTSFMLFTFFLFSASFVNVLYVPGAYKTLAFVVAVPFTLGIFVLLVEIIGWIYPLIY